MSDNKRLTGQPDRSKINIHERYEVYDTAKKLLSKAPPGTSLQQMEQAVIAAGHVPQFHSSRPMIERAALAKVGARPKLPSEK